MNIVEKIKNSSKQNIAYTVVILLIVVFFYFLLNSQYGYQSGDVKKIYTQEEKLNILDSLESDSSEKSKEEKLDILNGVPGNGSSLTIEEKLEIMNSIEENN